MLAAPPFNLQSNFDRVDDAIDSNADLALAMLTAAFQSFGIDRDPADPAMDWRGKATSSDMDKARSTIRQMYRDWSADGATERDSCYGPVLRDLARAFERIPDKSTVNVLIPGAGLGRLVFEICRRGYIVEGNEISYHQIIASNWALNYTDQDRIFHLFPFALGFSNVISRDHQLQRVKIPDVHPGMVLEEAFGNSSVPATDRMSMRAADFVVLYGDQQHMNRYDAVVTVFFIDTAPNLIRYIETIRNCLKDGGLWMNLGPLLWHFAGREPSDQNETTTSTRTKSDKPGIEEPGSFELTEEEVLLLVKKLGFEIQSHEVRNDGFGYIQNPVSMLQNTYRTSHWVAKKR